MSLVDLAVASQIWRREKDRHTMVGSGSEPLELLGQ
jgi:hypothetical protein